MHGTWGLLLPHPLWAAPGTPQNWLMESSADQSDAGHRQTSSVRNPCLDFIGGPHSCLCRRALCRWHEIVVAQPLSRRKTCCEASHTGSAEQSVKVSGAGRRTRLIRNGGENFVPTFARLLADFGSTLPPVLARNIVPGVQERADRSERAEQCSEHFLHMFRTCNQDQHAQAQQWLRQAQLMHAQHWPRTQMRTRQGGADPPLP